MVERKSVMKFGLFGGARVSEDGPRSDSQGYASFVNYIVEAERLGYESMFLVEHHFTGIGQVSSSMSLLAYLAAKTSTIRLGTGVVVLPWHNPVLVAEQAATLDLLSNGRFDFGVGRGYRKSEFEAFGVPMEEAAERFEEAIEVIRKSWVSKERFSHHGKRWNFENIVVEPPVRQNPHPPLWIGAGPHWRPLASLCITTTMDRLSDEREKELVNLLWDESRGMTRNWCELGGFSRPITWRKGLATSI
jgi:alkanesulfonate monooxygenase SsuD/methylene tetrahydromethanopterin reductase-like flavin-dependent oxidoreductase (luciferase family)